MKTKTVTAATLAEFAALLETKRITAAAAAKAAKAAKEAAAALGLSDETYLLKSSDKTLEVTAIWTERPVGEIAARVDCFHAFRVV